MAFFFFFIFYLASKESGTRVLHTKISSQPTSFLESRREHVSQKKKRYNQQQSNTTATAVRI